MEAGTNLEARQARDTLDGGAVMRGLLWVGTFIFPVSWLLYCACDPYYEDPWELRVAAGGLCAAVLGLTYLGGLPRGAARLAGWGLGYLLLAWQGWLIRVNDGALAYVAGFDLLVICAGFSYTRVRPLLPFLLYAAVLHAVIYGSGLPPDGARMFALATGFLMTAMAVPLLVCYLGEKRLGQLQMLSAAASETENTIIVLDGQRRLLWANAAFERTAGMTLPELIARKGGTLEAASTDPQIAEKVAEALRTRASVVYESRHNTADGREVWTQTTLTPVFENGPQPARWVLVESDITELRRIREELRRRNEEFVDSIQYAELLQRALLPPPPPDAPWRAATVFARPKALISGDFVWWNQDESHWTLVVTDAMGHGVPGAFLTQLIVQGLRRAVRVQKVRGPAAILEEVQAFMNESLPGREVSAAIAVLALDTSGGQWAFASAGVDALVCLGRERTPLPKAARPLLTGRPKTKAVPQVGGALANLRGFAAFTDGFSDQYGGPGERPRRFGRQAASDFLFAGLAAPQLPAEADLARAFDAWRGPEDQTDDVTVLLLAFGAD